MKERLKLLLQGPQKYQKLARLETKLKESREREQQWLDEAAYMKSKLQEMQDKEDDSSSKFDNELDRMDKDYRKLQAKYEQLLKTLQRTQEDCDNKYL